MLAGSQLSYRNDTDRELPFRQESNFFYLSGCPVPGSFFLATYYPDVATPDAKDVRAVDTKLYVPNPTLEDLMWSPAPPTISEARDAYDVDSVSHTEELSDHLRSLPADALVHILPRINELPCVHKSVANDSPVLTALNELHALGDKTEGGRAFTEEYLLTALHQTRLIKDAFEINLIRRANDISSRAHEVVMRVLGLAVQRKIKQLDQPASGRPLLPGEWLIRTEAEAEAIFVASCRREGWVTSFDRFIASLICHYFRAFHQAYLPIVAANTRAATLHYCCNDKAFAWGPISNGHIHNGGHLTSHDQTDKVLAPQVLLIDAGCEWECYSSDSMFSSFTLVFTP